MLQIEFRAMGCGMSAMVDAEHDQAAELLQAVPAWFAEWEAVLSRFDPSSELSALNRAGGRPMQVSTILWSVLQESLAAAAKSDYLITPTVLDALETAGYDRSFEELTLSSGHSVTTFAVESRSAEHGLRQHTVWLPGGMRLDLGGTAKGWAADQAAQRLAESGPALVDAGGDIAVSGPRTNGAPWLIGISNPSSPDVDLATLHLDHGAVATSGTDYRRWVHNGKQQHHIIDPRTGCAAETDVLSATVVANRALDAEVAAKVLLILGSKAGMEWLQQHGELAGLVVLNSGLVMRNDQMNELLVDA